MSRVKLIAETRVYICHKNMRSISLQCRRILGGRKLVYRIATMKPPSLILCQRKIGNMALSRLKPFARARWKRLHCRLEIYGHFFTVFREFSLKIQIKKYSTGSEEWIESETATITSDYVLHNHLSWAFHKLTCRQNKCTPPKNTNNTFIFL